MLAGDSNCRAKLGLAEEDHGPHSGVPFGVMAPEALLVRALTPAPSRSFVAPLREQARARVPLVNSPIEPVSCSLVKAHCSLVQARSIQCGSGTIVCPFAGQIAVVDETCPPKHRSAHSTRGFTSLGFSPKFANQNTTQKFGGHRKGRVHFKRVPGRRGRERSSLFRYQVPGTLVHHFQKRTHRGEASSHLRLQVDQSSHSHNSVQTTTLAAHFSRAPQKPMGLQNRSQGHILSFGGTSHSPTLSANSGRGKVVRIPGSMLWAQPFTPSLDVSHESVRETLESKRHSLFCLPGRHFGCQFFQDPVAGRNTLHVGNVARCRHGGKREELSCNRCKCFSIWGFA